MAIIIRGMSGIGGNNTGFAPGECKNILSVSGSRGIKISWEDPADTDFSAWEGTKLVRKRNFPPNNEKDGEVILDNKIRNKYADIQEPFIDESAEIGITYYYRLFPYTDKEEYNYSSNNIFSLIRKEFRVLGCIIDTDNPDPATSVTYMENTMDMTPGSFEWDDFFGIYPCLLKNGVEVGKLNPDDFSKLANGTPIDDSTGMAGDIMIAFPRHGLRMETIDNKTYIEMTDDPDRADFTYFAHARGDVYKNCFYLGVYEGYLNEGKVRSLAGKSCHTCESITRENIIKYVNANGSGYSALGFYQVNYILAMYALKYRNLNSRSKFGLGRLCNDTGILTGKSKKFGMEHSSSDFQDPVKIFGVEDMYGAVSDFIGGVTDCSLYSKYVYITTDPDIIDYKKMEKVSFELAPGSKTDTYGTIKRIFGDNKLGFLAKEVTNSPYDMESYFCSRLDGYNISMFHGKGESSETVSRAVTGIYAFNGVYGGTGSTDGIRLMYL